VEQSVSSPVSSSIPATFDALLRLHPG
jgi:hypothetical protein